ncbi:EpsG family protein [Bifidobacterium pseudolongum]|uniref:EpsG family protein n=1 Tax=Bifidobacterium pseudolongum TaxID=1694 RepID=UPI001020E581|nr:EpsG family protein [Bifidobacterium pseudolongum]RYQ54708.1 EpsG family [Bifidobacterium pseudolongum subsp. globosum]RYQ77414.1 EpsG family [Bifidobacterium pseudolongum subsp. globosum]
MRLYLLVFFAATAFAFIADVMQRQISNMGQGEPLSLHARHSLAVLRSGRVMMIIFSALVYILLSGLRYDTGYDYMYSYVPSLDVVRGGDVSHYDPFFNMIIGIFARFSSDQWFFACTAAYTVIMIYVGFSMDSKYIIVPVALFFTSFNYLRSFCFVAQYVAMATVFVGFLLLLKKRYSAAVILLVLGILIHKSAEVMIVLYLLYFLGNKIILILSFMFPLIAEMAQSLFRSLLISVSANSRFETYIDGQYDIGYEDMSLIYANLTIFLLFLFVVFCQREIFSYNKKGTMYLMIQSLALGFSLLQTVIPVGYRFVWYFALFQLISIPYMLRLILKGSLYYIVCAIICILYFFWMVKYPIANGASQVLPYHPVFNPNISIE